MIITGLSDKITSLNIKKCEQAKGRRIVSGQKGWKVKKTVVLVGMMGSGKTAVGKALAELLAVDFIDSDENIEKAAAMTVAEIFERDGEAFFRARETEVVDRLLNQHNGILSTGGGVFMQERNRDLIRKKGVSVWLDADLDLLWQRVRHKNTRPLLRTTNPYQTLSDLYTNRAPVYALADLTVKASADYSIDQMAGKVLEALKTRPDVLENI